MVLQMMRARAASVVWVSRSRIGNRPIYPSFSAITARVLSTTTSPTSQFYVPKSERNPQRPAFEIDYMVGETRLTRNSRTCPTRDLNFTNIQWGRHKSPYRKWRHMINLFRSAPFQRLLFPDLACIASLSAGLTFYNEFLVTSQDAMAMISISPTTFAGATAAISILASFRLNASYGANPPPFSDWGQPMAPPPAPPVSASVAPPPAASPPAATSATGGASGTAADAIATLDASQRQTVDTIVAAIPELAVKPDFTWNGEMVAGVPSTLDARDAPGPANIDAWLASLTIPSKVSSLTIFNGPLTDVPHLLSRVTILNDDTLNFCLDFRPRAYGAYEMKDEQGNYPGPEVLGRKAFEYSGARNDFDSKFGTDAVKVFMESTMNSFQGATLDTNPLSELDLLTRGPLCLNVNMPLTDANVAAIANARTAAANYWLTWAMDPSHEHRPGAPINSQFVYDQKYKQNAYGALLPVYTNMFGGAEGATVTAAESGPLDEAYVGGGS